MIAENKTFRKTRFTAETLQREYILCVFEDCDLSGLLIDNASLEECVFTRCNFSLARIATSLRDVKFVECKMTGTDFTEVSKFSHSVTFDRCTLDYAPFTNVKLHHTVFNNCHMHEVSFEGADMRSSRLMLCDLSRTSFHNANLEKADFSSAYNFSIDPNQTRIKKARFSTGNIRGLVEHLGIEII